MNKKAILIWLTLAVMIAATGCGNATPGEPTSTEEPEPAAVIEGELQQIIAFTFPVGTSNWTVAIKAAPFEAVKEYNYQLPDGWPQDIKPFEVGVVEIGAGSDAQGIYLVAIDLGSEEETVSGLLASTTDADIFAVSFQRVPQIVNPARGETAPFEEFQTLDPAQDIAAGITANGVCFVVKIVDKPNYNRYCSESGSLLSVRTNFASQYETLQGQISEAAERFGLQNDIQTEEIISEMEDPSHLDNCREQILSPAHAIQPVEPTATEVPTTLAFEAPLAPSIPDQAKPPLAFSPADTPPEAIAAIIQGSCGSDITIAPVKADYFKQKYDESKGQSTSISNQLMITSVLAPLFQANPFPVPVAVVQILQPIETTLGTVFPGDYQMHYWYQVIDGNDVFYAATITGTTTGDVEVTNQQVPAVPATFINEDGTEQTGSQISTCRIFGRCTFFQTSCS